MRAEAAQAAKKAKAAKTGLVTVAKKDPQWEQLKREVAAMQLDSSLVQVDVEALRARVESDWQVRARFSPSDLAKDGTRNLLIRRCCYEIDIFLLQRPMPIYQWHVVTLAGRCSRVHSGVPRFLSPHSISNSAHFVPLFARTVILCSTHTKTMRTTRLFPAGKPHREKQTVRLELRGCGR